jgi:hypothetical protein
MLLWPYTLRGMAPLLHQLQHRLVNATAKVDQNLKFAAQHHTGFQPEHPPNTTGQCSVY